MLHFQWISTLIFIALFLDQTLTDLYLLENRIGNSGAQCIVEALRNNQVKSIDFSDLIFVMFTCSFLLQTLQAVYLNDNNNISAASRARFRQQDGRIKFSWAD